MVSEPNTQPSYADDTGAKQSMCKQSANKAAVAASSSSTDMQYIASEATDMLIAKFIGMTSTWQKVPTCSHKEAFLKASLLGLACKG